MQIITEQLQFSSKGFTDIKDLSQIVQNKLSELPLQEGQVTVFALGSTAAITIIEFEPGLVKTDLPELLEKIAPYKKNYAHHGTWGDDNGAAHLRASLIGGSYVVPFSQGQLMLSTWQQLIHLDFDTRPRQRTVVLQFLGI